HELRHRNGWMGIVQLYRDHVRQSSDGFALQVEQPQHVLQRARDEEVLLSEAQTLACLRLVVWVKNLGQGFRFDLLVYRAVIVAVVEVREIEGLNRLPPPQAQCVAGFAPKPERWNATGDPLPPPCRYPSHPIVSLRIRVSLRVTAEADVRGDIVVN